VQQREAVKAQAVAARTYTYRKMMERDNESYDLMATVADQVYGGAGAEDTGSDRAVDDTRGLVLTWENEPIVAYYHSTCGGSTASPEDVWGKQAAPYLRVSSDRRPDGTPWCSASTYATWTVSWKTERLTALLQRYAADAACEGTYQGRVKKLRVDGRFACGRVKRLVVEASGGTSAYCGDRTRFALRRDQSGNPILPSARFDVASQGSTEVKLSGSGYGHGVGMCQMGALGRATDGQTFAAILSAYYPGAVLMEVEAPGRISPARQRL
jgi:stage II sporulation protein D